MPDLPAVPDLPAPVALGLESLPTYPAPVVGQVRVVDLRHLLQRGAKQAATAVAGTTDDDALDLLHLAG